MSEAITKAQSTHITNKQLLQDTLILLNKSINELISKNSEDELKYRKEKNKIETLLNNKKDEYNQNISQRQENLKEIEYNYNNELIEYNKLKIYYDDVDAKLAKKESENQILLNRKIIDDNAWNKLHYSISIIQKIIRGRQARAIYIKMKAKAKAKKGKKKGKK